MTTNRTLEFGGALYPTPRAMCHAIASAWMTADGNNTNADIAGFFGDTDEQLADDCIQGWGLDQPVVTDTYSCSEAEPWMDERGIDRDDIIKGFADYRREFMAAVASHMG